MISAPTRYRALFLSDFHLGSPNCQAERLHQFLLAHDADSIYLIGDIIEGHHLRKWPKFHDNVLHELAAKSLVGTKLFFIPGNHDSVFRFHFGIFGNMQIIEQILHEGQDGRIWLVTHGDETDLSFNNIWLWAVVLIERISGCSLWEMLRKYFGSWIKRHTEEFEGKMIKLSEGYAGIICGHIHLPKLSSNYINTGDWISHCTAIAERYDGTFELLTG